jgi:nitrous oxide reductase
MGRPGRRRLLLVAPAVIGLALATAACGGSPKTGVASLGTTTTAAPAGARASGGPSYDGDLVEYARCMRSHGVLNFPDDPASTGLMLPWSH